MQRWIGTVVVGLGLLGTVAAETATAADALAPKRSLGLSADEIEYEKERDVYVARGNVRITQADRTLTADWVSFNNTTRLGVASGNVVVREGADELHAEFIEFNVDTLRGSVFEGSLVSESSRFRMEGQEVRRTATDTYLFRRGLFTTCRCPEKGRDPWAIRASKAELEVGGYGTARNTTFEIFGVPVLWLPWMIYPLKTERETGFLFPRIGGGTRSGGDTGLPFFWAARHNVNVLLTPGYASKRGFKPSLDVEYVFGEHSQGEISGSFIRDREIDRDDPSTPFPDDRWAVEWRHDQYLPDDWRLKADARLASDNLYPFDFHELRDYRSDRFLESRGFLERHFGRYARFGLNGGVQLADDLQNPDDSDRDDLLLQRLPNVDLRLVRGRFRRLPRLVRELDLRYTYYRAYESPEDALPTASVVGDGLFLDTGIDGLPDTQERNSAGGFGSPDGSLDDFAPGPEGDGRFEEGEPLGDRGHRVLVSPRLGLPLRLGDLFELYPEVGYQGTFYSTREQGFEDRHLVTGRLDLRAQLRRRWQLPFGGGEVLHVLEPRLGWALVSHASQNGNPLFLPRALVVQRRIRELEFDNITRDPADRIESFDGIVWGVGNRVFRSGEEGALPLLRADVSATVSYNFSGNEWGLFVLQGVVDPLPRVRTHLIVGYDLDETRLGEALFRVGWSHPAGHSLGLAYRFVRDIPRFFESFQFDRERFDDFKEGFGRVDQLSFTTRVALTPSWALNYQLGYSFERSLLLGNAGSVEYTSKCKCWAAGIELSADRSAGFGVQFKYTLIGLGDDTQHPFSGGRGGGPSIL